MLPAASSWISGCLDSTGSNCKKALAGAARHLEFAGSRCAVLSATMVGSALPHSQGASGYRRLADRPARLALSWPRSRLATLAEEA
jgi:hypothetical protein